MRQAGIDGTLTFEPVPDGTRMHWSWHVRPKGPSKLLAPVINWMGERTPGADCVGSHEAVPAGTTAEAVTATLAPFGVRFPANRRGEHPVGPTAAG